MVKTLSTLLVVASAAALMAAGAAEAQTPRKVRVARAKAPNAVIAELTAPPLVVKKRSFLDPGNAVPVGSQTPEYIASNTTELRPITSSYAPAFFGESELPGRFDLPPSNPRFNPPGGLDFSPF